MKQMVRSQPRGAMTCDQLGHDRMRWVIEKKLRKESITMWSVGHMGGLQCDTGMMVQCDVGNNVDIEDQN